MLIKDIQRLIIGSANFGIDYGIANINKRVSVDEVERIVEFTKRTGMFGIDTASAYGISEEVLGKIGIEHLKVVSKIPAFSADCVDFSMVGRSIVENSLEKLGIPKLHTVLLHRPDQLFSKTGSHIYSAMRELKNNNLTELIGCSVYEVEELERIQRGFDFDLYQIPYNILDRRFLESGLIDRLVSKGIQVHARSVFLQGLLLIKREDRPHWLKGRDNGLDEWDEFVNSSGQSAANLCLDFVFQNPNLSGIVVGVDTLNQLLEIQNFLTSDRESLDFHPSFVDPLLCDPRLWASAAKNVDSEKL